MSIFGILSVFVEHPLLAFLPALLLLALAVATARVSCWVAAAAWAIYGFYELAMSRRLLCSGECDIRVDLLVISPLLLGLTLVALVRAVMFLFALRPRPGS